MPVIVDLALELNDFGKELAIQIGLTPLLARTGHLSSLQLYLLTLVLEDAVLLL